MNFFDHKDLGNHLLQLCPKVVKHPVYACLCVCVCVCVCVCGKCYVAYAFYGTCNKVFSFSYLYSAGLNSDIDYLSSLFIDVGKPEGKRPLGRPRRRWVDNIRLDLQEVGCGHVDWIGLAQDRDRWRTLVSAVMNLRVP